MICYDGRNHDFCACKLPANTGEQFVFVIITTVITRCLFENFKLICYSQRVNATCQYDDSGSSSFFKMIERSGFCSGETVAGSLRCARKKRVQKKMTKDYLAVLFLIHTRGMEDNFLNHFWAWNSWGRCQK